MLNCFLSLQLKKCKDFTKKDDKGHWPSNTTCSNQMDYHVWENMLHAYQKVKLNQKITVQLISHTGWLKRANESMTGICQTI